MVRQQLALLNHAIRPPTQPIHTTSTPQARTDDRERIPLDVAPLHLLPLRTLGQMQKIHGAHMWWMLVRIAGIIVATATMLRLALTEGLVTYDLIFQAWMDRLSDFIELGFFTDLMEPLLLWAIDWVRSFGLSLPDLQPEWRPAFILSGLFLGALGRNGAGGSLSVAAGIMSALTGAVIGGLIGDVASGFVSAALVFSILNLIQSVAALRALRNRKDERADHYIVPRYSGRRSRYPKREADAARMRGLALLADKTLIAVLSVAPLLLVIVMVSFAPIFAITATTPLVAIFVIGFGFYLTASGFWRAFGEGDGPALGRINSGLDILSATGVAFGLAVYFSDPPIL